MLPKCNRLKAKRAFDATYRNKNSVSDKYIVMYAGKPKEDKNCPTGVGFVVSKKVHKRAVKRNRIKRLMRESIRSMFKNGETEEINKYQSLIFIAGKNSVDKSFDDVRNTILNLLKKPANKNI